MNPRIKAGLGIELESTLPNSSLQGPSCAGSGARDMSSLRSSQGMQGLLSAEKGEGMVELDFFSRGSGFKEGQRIALEAMTPGGGFIPPKDRTQPSGPRPQTLESQTALARQGTILAPGESPSRTSQDLKSLLGNAHSKLKHGATVLPLAPLTSSQSSENDAVAEPISIEQAKSRARVEIDIILESNSCVQGDSIKGLIKLRIRKRSGNERRVLVSEGKVRIIGFECIPHVDDRHTFYQCAERFSSISPGWEDLFDSDLDEEGFGYGKEGLHVLPFIMKLPLEGTLGNPKGILNINSGVSVRYIAMASVKVKDSNTGRRSIAHFYRDCEIWPRLDPSSILSSAPRPLHCTVSKNLFMGGPGNVRVSASLHRLHWVAGQRCYVTVIVENDTTKTVKSLTLFLIRRTTLFRPRPELDTGNADPDACHTSTTYRMMAETTLEMSQRVAKGHASSKGWWTGIAPGESSEFQHFILLPPDALSVTRGRLLEVEYCIRVSISASSLTSSLSVDLPIRIVNFLSIDIPATVGGGCHGEPTGQRSICTDIHQIESLARNGSPSYADDPSSKGRYVDSTLTNSQSVAAESPADDSDIQYEECQEDFLGDDHLSDHRLGNLDDADNSDEEVDLVVGTARIDQSENDFRFSSRPDPQDTRHPVVHTYNFSPIHEISESSTGRTSGNRMRSKTTSAIPWPSGRSNSFAIRVQEKIANAKMSFASPSSIPYNNTVIPEVHISSPKLHYDRYVVDSKAQERVASLPFSRTGASHSDLVPLNTAHSAIGSHPSTHLSGLSTGLQSNSSIDQSSASNGSNVGFDHTEHLDMTQSITTRDTGARNGDVSLNHGFVAEKVKLTDDKTSEVKKRIKELESKMRSG